MDKNGNTKSFAVSGRMRNGTEPNEIALDMELVNEYKNTKSIIMAECIN